MHKVDRVDGVDKMTKTYSVIRLSFIILHSSFFIYPPTIALTAATIPARSIVAWPLLPALT